MRFFHNKKGAGHFVEYSITFFLVVGFATGMSMFVRRTLQARIHGAADYTMHEVETIYYDPSANLTGRLYKQYEPYYAKSQATKTQDSTIVERTIPAPHYGIFEKNIISDKTVIQSQGVQAPPKDAN